MSIQRRRGNETERAIAKRLVGATDQTVSITDYGGEKSMMNRREFLKVVLGVVGGLLVGHVGKKAEASAPLNVSRYPMIGVESVYGVDNGLCPHVVTSELNVADGDPSWEYLGVALSSSTHRFNKAMGCYEWIWDYSADDAPKVISIERDDVGG